MFSSAYGTPQASCSSVCASPLAEEASPVVIPAMFAGGLCVTEAHEALFQTLFQEALKTPALPAKRGELKLLTKQAVKKTETISCSEGTITFGHARSGKIRTYMLVKKKIWLEISRDKHKDHCAIVLQCGRVTSERDLSQQEAKDYLKRLLEVWPDSDNA